MEKERQKPRPQTGRGATGRGNTLHPERRPVTVSRPYPRSERPAPRTLPQEHRTPVVPPRSYPPTTAQHAGQFRRIVRPKRATPPPVRKNPLSAERFRDVLWPEERDDPAQNRIAFLLSLLYALIYAGCSLLLVYPLNLLTARMPFPLSAVIRALFPALIGTAFCMLTRLYFPEEPRMMILAYRKLLWNVLWVFIALQALLWGEWAAQQMIARFALLFILAPLIVGTGVSVLLLYLDWLNETDTEKEDA